MEEFEFARNDIENKVIYLRDKFGVIHGIDHKNFSDWHYGQIGYNTYLAFSNKTLKSCTEEHKMYDSITVSCRGFTGTMETLLKAETGYNLSIRDTENAVTHVLENVKPNEIKLVSGKVTMG